MLLRPLINGTKGFVAAYAAYPLAERLERRDVSSKARILDRDRLLHLEQQIRARPDVVDGRDACADALVCVISEGASDPGTGLDDDLVSALRELARTGRRERDAVLLRLDLPRNADPHARGTISRQALTKPAT